jgi:hypothetical protein
LVEKEDSRIITVAIHFKLHFSENLVSNGAGICETKCEKLRRTLYVERDTCHVIDNYRISMPKT